MNAATPASPDISAVTALRARLWDSGFRPVAVYNQDKAPKGLQWEVRAQRTPPDAASRDAEADALNTGIWCGGLRAIDIDIDDKDEARRVKALALDMFGETPMRCRSNSAKTTLIYRAAEGEPEKRSITGPKHDTKNNSQKVEILGYGQHTLSFGRHPSGVDLQWMPEAPGDVTLDSLAPVTEEQIGVFLAGAATIIGAVTVAATSASSGEHRLSSLGAVSNIFEVAGWLNAIPNDQPANWDFWNNVGLATWAATEGKEAGRDLFHAWSRKHPQYDAAHADERWNHYPSSPPTKSGGGTLSHLAKLARKNSPPAGGLDEPKGLWPDTCRTRTPAGGPRWGEPVDFLADDTTGAPPLEAKHIPAALWPFVTDTAARMGVDPSGVALAALVSCAAVISDDWALQPKRLDFTWTENARIWGAIVGDPSILKSPVISACTKPIDRLEVEARERHAEEMRKWRVEEAAAKADKVPPPRQPKLDRYMVEGVTPEALSEVLRDDDEAKMRAPAGKVLSRHDEMSEFFGGLDRYKAAAKGGSERGSYLRLYNGGRFTVDRIGRGSFAVPNWSACFLGGVQPGPIQRIAREAADDGLLQRFLYAVPDGQKRGLDRAPDQTALDRYTAMFPALAVMRPRSSIVGGTAKPSAVVFHADAHQHREDIDALATAMAAMPDTSSRLKAAFGKWAGQFARLCLTFHLVNIADARARGQMPPVDYIVTEATARQVAAYMRDIVLPHMLRAESVMFSSDQTGHARWIAGFILAHRMERIATRDVTRAYRAFRPPEAKAEMVAVMASLVAVGWLEAEEQDNPGKPVSSWLVNPGVHTAFANRAQAEADRRAATKGQIADSVAAIRCRRDAAA